MLKHRQYICFYIFSLLTEFSIQKLLWQSECQAFWGHVGGVSAGGAGPFYDLRVRNVVLLPSDMEKSAEEAQVEL